MVRSNVCPGGVGPTAPNLPSGAPPAPTISTGTTESGSTTTKTASSTSPTSSSSGALDGDDYYVGDEHDPICDYSLTYTDLVALDTAAGGFRTECIAVYALETLNTMLDTALADYDSVNDGYDEQFGYYVKYIEKLIPSVLDKSFMFDENTTTEYENIPVPGPGMKCKSRSKPT